MVRKVGSNGGVCFAGTSYRVGNAYRGAQVEVRLVGDTVEISKDGAAAQELAGAARPLQGARRLLDARRAA